jgi:mRNA-degrading endonuclease YafQ of YafQ-DinJ toxin-antitoxin module
MVKVNFDSVFQKHVKKIIKNKVSGTSESSHLSNCLEDFLVSFDELTEVVKLLFDDSESCFIV